MATSNFLDSLPILTDEQRASLRAQDLDAPAAIVVLSAAEIAQAAGLTLGKAGLLLSAARDAHTNAARDQDEAAATERDHKRKQTQVVLALQALRADPQPHRRKAVLDLGVVYVTIDANDKVTPERSLELLRDLENGAPVPKTWRGERVVAVRDLGAPTVFCHPRTHEALQAGVDEKTLVPWGELGVAGMRLAAYAYREGMVYGMSDRAVFEAIRDNVNGLNAQLELRAKNLKFDLAEMDTYIIYQARMTADTRPDLMSAPKPRPLGPLRDGGSNVSARLAVLLRASFSSDELHRFVRYLPGGEELAAELPGVNAPASTLASAAADLLRRQGRIDRALRDRLVAERPGRAGEIDAFFGSLL